MTEYIEREAVLNKCLTAVMLTCADKYELVNLITEKEVRNIPAADVQPVKRGKWIDPDNIVKGLFDNFFTCSECKGKSCIYGNYCPNCGARMDEKEEHCIRDIFMTR